MALLRPCARLTRYFFRTPTRCQLKSPSKLVVSYQGYTAVLPTREYSEVQKLHSKLIESSISDAEVLDNHLVLLSARLLEMQVPYDHLLAALQLYSSLDASDSTGLLLLSCCGEVLSGVSLSTRQKLTYDVWNLLINKCNLSLEHYHTLLAVCAQNRVQIKPEEFLKSMRLPPTEATYVHMLNVAGKTGDLNASRFLLSRMKELEFTLCPEALVSIVEVYCANGDMQAAEDTLNSIVLSGVQPDTQIYASLACCYASRGDVENVQRLVASHEFSDNQLIDVIKCLCLSETVDDAVKILDKLPKEKTVENPAFITAVVGLLGSGKLTALGVVKCYIKDLDNTHISKFLALVLKPLVCNKNSAQSIIEEFEELKNTYKFNQKESMRVLLSLLEESLRTSYVELSLALFRELRKENIEIRPHYFWPLFIHMTEERGEAGVFKVINEMSSLDVQPDHDTLLKYVLPSVSTLNPKLTLRKLIGSKIRASTALTSLVCYLLDKKLPSEAIKLQKSSQRTLNFDKVVQPLIQYFEESNDVNSCAEILALAPYNRDHVGKFLIGVFNKTEIDEQLLKRFVNAFRKRNIQISRATCDYFLESLYSKTFDDCDHVLKTIVGERATKLHPDRVAYIPHPRNMAPEDLQCHLIELKSKHKNYRGVLRKLFAEYCKAGDLQQVEKVRSQYENLEEVLTPGMKSHLLELYAKKGKIAELREVILDLQKNHPNFAVDDFKILTAAKALVEQDEVDFALEIVDNHGHASKQTHQAWQLLDAIARSPNSNLVDKAFELLTRRKFCSIHTTTLGPLIRPYLLRNDLPAAVVKFEEIYKLYQMTPLRLELMERLVEIKAKNPMSNADNLLFRVVQCVVSLHGMGAATKNQICAYAKNGMMEELTELLKKVKYFEITFRDFPYNYENEMKLKVFLNIVEASRGMKHVNRELLYKSLLDIYSEMNNYEGVANLWNTSQNDIALSIPLKESFMRILSSLSKKGQ